MQAQSHAFFLTQYIDRGLNAQEAADAARTLVMHSISPRGPGHKTKQGSVFHEVGVCSDVVEALGRRGHVFGDETPAAVGEVAAIVRDEETGYYAAVTDKRRDGLGVGY